jgi:tetratricopeptide (TPR) repeat protein
MHPRPLGFLARLSPFSDPRWLLAPWALYLLATAMIFHVELRYRLPLFPVLLPYAALAIYDLRLAIYDWRRLLASAIIPLAAIALTLTHSFYPALAWRLAAKHIHLANAERALAVGDAAGAQSQALAALALDDRSALAHVALARAAMARGDSDGAQITLRIAIDALPAHPQPHLLLGDILRAEGQLEAARQELVFESGSLQDLQAWSWERFASPPPSELDVGGGLDLGFVRGMHAADEGGWRWTRDVAQLRIAADGDTLRLRLAAGRPAGAPQPALLIQVNGATLATLRPTAEWQTYDVPLPAGHASPLTIELRADTFRARDYDRASGDDRALGVMLDSAAVTR